MTRLTTAEIASLEGQALANAVAERVMGWTLDESGYWIGRCGETRLREYWSPHEDHNDAARVMDQIKELGRLYKKHLNEMWGLYCKQEPGIGFEWWLHVASPTDRCRAALMAVEGER